MPNTYAATQAATVHFSEANQDYIYMHPTASRAAWA
jgi:hypothetical protein